MLIQRYLNTYWYLYLSLISRRSLQNLYLSYGVYTCSKVPVGITEITERILVLWNLFLYGSTCRHYGVYSGISEHILVFRILYVYYRTYTCLTKLILVLRNLYWYFGSCTGVSDLILVLRSIYMYFGFYTCITELIHVFQILYMYFRSYTCLIEYILVLRILYLFYRTYYYLTDLILVLQNLLLPYESYSCAKVPVGTVSRNISGSSHIQGQIRLLQIRTLVFHKYKS